MPNDTEQSYGFIPREMQGRDLMFGAGAVEHNIDIEPEEWPGYFSAGQVQHGVYFDSMSCVSQAGTNKLEAIMNYQYRHNVISLQNEQWLEANGYIVDGQVRLSARFTAKKSGTSHQGNTGDNVNRSMRNDGVVPESLWPFPFSQRQPVYDWDDYYAEIPQAVTDLGLEFARRFNLQYEQLFVWDWQENVPARSVIRGAMRHGPLQVFVHAWDQPVGGVYRRTPRGINHAVAMQSSPVATYEVFDSYLDQYQPGDYVKTLAGDFIFYPTAYLYTLTQRDLTTQPMQNVKIIKDRNSAAVGIWLPALSPAALESYCQNFGIVVPKKPDGTPDWEAWIDGELTLNR